MLQSIIKYNLLIIIVFIGIQSHFDGKVSSKSIVFQQSTTQIPHSLTSSSGFVEKEVLIFEIESQKCLGIDGFSQCSDLTKWIWKPTEKGVLLVSTMHQQDDEPKERICLGRKKTTNDFKLIPCDTKSIFPSIYWRYDRETGKLFSPPNLLGSRCVLHTTSIDEPTNQNNYLLTSNAILASCEQGFTPLQIIPVSIPSDHQLHHHHTPTTQDEFEEERIYECPNTKQHMPCNLDNYHLVTPATASANAIRSQQMLMGAGIFTKTMFGMNFHVCEIGWYVNIQSIQTEKAFQIYSNLTKTQLLSSSSFFQLMYSSNLSYERSMLIKLSMSIPKDILINGLLQEMNLTLSHAQAIQNLSTLYQDIHCPEGLDILLHWIPHYHQNQNQNDGEELLEIQIGSNVKVVSQVSGLAEDFFYQYFRSDLPVSEELKHQLVAQFPAILHPHTTITTATTTTALINNSSNTTSNDDNRNSDENSDRNDGGAVIVIIGYVFMIIFSCLPLYSFSLPLLSLSSTVATINITKDMISRLPSFSSLPSYQSLLQRTSLATTTASAIYNDSSSSGKMKKVKSYASYFHQR